MESKELNMSQQHFAVKNVQAFSDDILASILYARMVKLSLQSPHTAGTVCLILGIPLLYSN